MIKTTSFKETNAVYGHGGNKNTEQVAVCIATDTQNNSDCVITRWKLEDEDIQRILLTKEINVVTMGTQLLPQFLTVFDPIKEHRILPKEL